MVRQGVRTLLSLTETPFETHEATDGIEALTERETEILRLMVAGWNNKEIARGLDVMEGTVKNHVSRILSKLGVRDRTRAVLRAIELGLVRA
ncbi:MAG: response regulator transcription factor [Trueperaceae bacterium]|nr:response regulator transcription factor [Trueperaceae bacterium]